MLDGADTVHLLWWNTSIKGVRNYA